MKYQTNLGDMIPAMRAVESFGLRNNIVDLKKYDDFKSVLQHYRLPNLDDLLAKLAEPPQKKSFLVFKNNKYIIVPTEKIAFFHVKHESPVIRSFDKQEYFVSHSLEQIQSLVSDKQFFRLNRQYLVNFDAIKEVEHYFARKLLVNLVIHVTEKLIVSKEKVTGFLHWLDNR